MTNRRVVITGMGLISPIGCTIADATSSLFTGKSGIALNQSYIGKELSSQISGQLPDAIKFIKNKKITRFMSMGAGYSYLAMVQALKDSDLPNYLVHDYKTGLIIGTGGGSPAMCVEIGQKLDGAEVYEVYCLHTLQSVWLAHQLRTFLYYLVSMVLHSP